MPKKGMVSAYNKQSIDWQGSVVESRGKSPGNPAPRSKAHPQKRPSIPRPPVPTQDRLPITPVAKNTKAKSTLEVSGVYDVPIGAWKRSVGNTSNDDIYDEPNCVIQYTAQPGGRGNSSHSLGGWGNSSHSGGAAIDDDDEDYTPMDLVVNNIHSALDSADDGIYELV